MDGWLRIVFPFFWVLLRTSGVLMTAPVVGTRYVPWTVKVAISLVTGYILWSFVPAVDLPGTLEEMAVRAAGEVILGLFLGFIGTIMMAAIETAGHLADMEVGFGLANVVDPQYGQPSPLLGILKYLLVTLMFLAIDGHHIFIRALYDSFVLVPAGGATIPSSWAQVGIMAVSKMMWTALILSCPVWASALIVDITLGMIARSVPQLNVFVVGMPLKTLVGLGIISASVTFYGVFTKDLVLSIKNLIDGLLGVFAR
ncbi:MAG TPA: flagellar biosynthetic protein FliR [Firmicutes bacterium]|nr:flagellar biosynthetic protein FliR [Candidatus Fermentithermobacillaceae bacterium]